MMNSIGRGAMTINHSSVTAAYHWRSFTPAAALARPGLGF
jgi:hypothetical protein